MKIFKIFIFFLVWGSFSYSQEKVDIDKYVEVENFQDGSKISEDKLDGIIYLKRNNKYFKKKFNGAIKSVWFGCKGDGVSDDSNCLQNAINTCLFWGYDLEIDGKCLIKRKIVINRLVDNDKFRNFFITFSNSEGGFKIVDNVGFTSSLTGVNPVSQLIKFQNIFFEGDNNYVLDSNKFFWTQFNSCSFSSTKLLFSNHYIQSIYLFNCNIRNWSGEFITSTERTSDLKINGCLVEAGGTFLNISEPYGSSIIGSTIEGMFGNAVIFDGAKCFSIIGNYFESNRNGDIISRNSPKQNDGVAIIGNFFYNTNKETNEINYSIDLNNTVAGVSLGNTSLAKLHKTISKKGVDVYDNIDDKVMFNIMLLNKKIKLLSQNNFYMRNRDNLSFRLELDFDKDEVDEGIKIIGFTMLTDKDEIMGYSTNLDKLIFIKKNEFY